MADVFISFSSKDERRVADIHAHLRKQGFDVWWMKNIPPGASTIRAVSAQLEDAKKVVLAWSRHASESAYVEGEIMYAFGARKLVPIRLEKCSWPAFLSSVQYVDLTQSDDASEAWRRIEERLKTDQTNPASYKAPRLAVPRSVGPATALAVVALALMLALAALSTLAVGNGSNGLSQATEYGLLALPALGLAPVLIAGWRLWLAWRSRPRPGEMA